MKANDSDGDPSCSDWISPAGKVPRTLPPDVAEQLGAYQRAQDVRAADAFVLPEGWAAWAADE